MFTGFPVSSTYRPVANQKSTKRTTAYCMLHTEDSIKINGIRVQLLNYDLWQEFKKLGNEMMVMPRSRRIFPGKIDR